ncbi:MAG TPA: glycerophosphodiester phosphodiesterase [Burkholderiaceae bacterium]|nr:glycerophosphodiester phosphodiesterase [Burkholderiaceae bacterium]
MPRGLRGVTAAALLTAVVLLGGCASAFDVQGHRGARGLAPENTLAAFRAALQAGVDTIESDMAVTRDGVIVMAHDSRLNPQIVRQADGRWIEPPGAPIRSLTLAQLRGYDIGRLRPEGDYAKQWPRQNPADGERFPTLTELFDLVKAQPRRIALNLETKITPTSGAEVVAPAEFARLVVDAVRASGLASVVTIQSFDWRTLVEVRRLAPEIPTACLTIETERSSTVRTGPDGVSPWLAGLRSADHAGSVPRMAAAAGCSTWSMFWRDLTEARVREARALGLKVLPWTVNETADMQRLIGWGVDGLITDYPDRLIELRRSR